ncbi:MAG: sulfotransferase domain-containing protein [Bacteroidales bacterium]
MAGKKIIFVTGAHRSGTTWVGKMLSLNPGIRYIHEPFNIDEPRVHPFRYWFEYIHDKTPAERQKEVFNFLYGLSFYTRKGIQAEIKSINGPRDILRLTGNLLSAPFTIPLIKDPLAIMSTEWIANKFNARVVIMVRHPAAFVASIKVKKWTHPFDHFTSQPDLMEVLSPFAAKINEFASAKTEQDLIEQGILLWNIIYHRVSELKDSHPKWIYVRHEDLSVNPLEEYQKLYRQLGLKFTNIAKKGIIESTTAIKESRLARDSRKNITTWKSRLTPEEIERIKEGTRKIWSIYYTPEDW